MIITIEVSKDQEDEIRAVGAQDLRTYFLPKAGIFAARVRISSITEENAKLRSQGKEYFSFNDESTKGECDLTLKREFE